MAKKNLTYKDKIEEIEQIIEFVQSNPVDIDLLQAKIERAVQLIAECKKEIAQTEDKIQRLLDNTED